MLKLVSLILLIQELNRLLSKRRIKL